MNDPHVEWLKYRVETASDLSYGSPSPVVGEATHFKYRLEKLGGGDVLTLEMKSHFTSESEACAAARPFLEAWQISAALNGNLEQLLFRFAEAHIVDRAPSTGKSHAMIGAGVTMTITGRSECALVLNSYPPPPPSFLYTPDVAVLWNRYASFRKGTEPLLSVAYFCYSYVCLTGGGKRNLAAAKYNVEEALLIKLSNLAATGGDWSEARKAEKDSTGKPLTAVERTWLETAIKLLIERMATYAADPAAALKQIVLTDLPTL